MKTSEQINDLAAASAKAQGAMRAAVKDSTNPHYKSKYADLTAVWEACRQPLADNDLTVWQDVTSPETALGIGVTTRLVHSSGQWVEFGPLIVPLSKADAHGVGSATSYAKRYALAAALGVTSEDDDGNAATEKPAKIAPKRMRKIVDGMLAANAALDGPALLSIWDELENDEKLTVWSELRSWERSSLKDLMNKAKAGAGIGLDGWSIQLLRGAPNLDALASQWKAVQDAFAANDAEVPLDVETVYQDRKTELG
jgi:hypothetical protein